MGLALFVSPTCIQPKGKNTKLITDVYISWCIMIKNSFHQRLNRQIREKSARLHKRLDEIRGQMMDRLEKQKNEMKNKMIEIAKHQQEVVSDSDCL